MKKLFLTGIGFFLALTLTFAQQVTPEEHATQVTTELTQKLSLTDEQKTAAYTITLDQAKAESALLGDTTATKEVLVEQINKLQAEADVKVDALLTEDQKELFKKVVAERPAKVIPEVVPQPVKEEKKENTEETNKTP
jgi:protein CpxP